MSTQNFVRIALLCTLFASTCASALGLRIPREELVAKIRVIGILPAIDALSNTDVSDGVDPPLAQSLRSAGFQVVEAGKYRETELEVRKQAGGWFDPITGRADPRKSKDLMDRAMQVYVERYKPDGLLRARVEERPLNYDDEKHVRFDGVEENIVASESLIAAINHGVGILDTGQFSVVSLVVGLYDMQGQVLFAGRGGIGARSVLVRKRFTPVDLPGLLQDAPRMAQAGDIAVHELVSKTSTAQVPVKFVSMGSVSTAPSAAPPEVSPVVQRTQLQKTVKTIAVLPIDLYGIGYEESIRAIYHNRLAQGLKAAGYDVVSRSDMAHLIQDAAEQVGGVFDPISGAPIEDRRAKAHEIQVRILKEQHHADALLEVTFPRISVPFNQRGQVQWDGVSQSALASNAHIDRFATFQGTLPAISLSVRLTDLDGTLLYSRRTGIELLSRFTGHYFEKLSWTQVLMDEDKAIAPTRAVLSGLTEN